MKTEIVVVQEQALWATKMSCAARCAAGEHPEWFWFRKLGSCSWDNDGSYALVTSEGLVVGNVHKGAPRLLKTQVEMQRWATGEEP